MFYKSVNQVNEQLIQLSNAEATDHLQQNFFYPLEQVKK